METEDGDAGIRTTMVNVIIPPEKYNNSRLFSSQQHKVRRKGKRF
jgi:hypothetical protein